MPEESQTVYPAYRFSIAPMLDRMYRFWKTIGYVFCGSLLGTYQKIFCHKQCEMQNTVMVALLTSQRLQV